MVYKNTMHDKEAGMACQKVLKMIKIKYINALSPIHLYIFFTCTKVLLTALFSVVINFLQYKHCSLALNRGFLLQFSVGRKAWKCFLCDAMAHDDTGSSVCPPACIILVSQLIH